MPGKRTLYSLFLFVLFIAYWIFVWRMERIVVTPDQVPLPFTIPPTVANALGIFYPRVLRHFIPLLIGWLLAVELSTNLIFALYDLPDRATARAFLRHLRNPRFGGTAYAAITAQDLELQRKDNTLIRVGGPGRVTVATGQAAVSEVNSRFLRILNSGTHSLDRFERIHSVLDLRPQERSDADVRLHSREGLEVTTYLGITFRVSKGASIVSEQTPYPFDPAAVGTLAYDQSNLAYSEHTAWEDTAVFIVTNILAGTVERYSLNQLLQEESTEVGAHLNIRRDVEREARIKLLERGIDLILIRIGRFRFPEDVTEQYIEQWRSIQENNLRHNLAEREAIAMQAMEVARAEAELEIVRAMAASMTNAQRQGYRGTLNEIMAVRFVEALERLAKQSGLEMKLPDHLLPQLHHLQQQLQLAVETGPVDGHMAENDDPILE